MSCELLSFTTYIADRNIVPEQFTHDSVITAATKVVTEERNVLSSSQMMAYDIVIICMCMVLMQVILYPTVVVGHMSIVATHLTFSQCTDILII